MKIDQILIIPHSLEPCAESEVWYKAKLGPWILISAESREELCEAFVIFIVILLTIPNSAQVHRYGPGFADSKDSLTKQYQLQLTGGWFSNDLVSETFSNLFWGNSIKFSCYLIVSKSKTLETEFLTDDWKKKMQKHIPPVTWFKCF